MTKPEALEQATLGDELAADRVNLQWGITIPVRDGTHLSATLYIPKESGCPAPTIVCVTPYVAQTLHDRGLFFAANGFPFLAVDTRGRGNSEGDFVPFVHDADDTYDVVAWASDQPFCSGAVGMWGGSYSGFVQWAAAGGQPKGLTTIAPAAAPMFGVDFPARSNILRPYLIQWLTLVWGRTSQDQLFWGREAYWGKRFRHWYVSGRPFSELDICVGMPSETFKEWVKHPEPAYWERFNPTPDGYANISQPVLTITGAYDADQPGALAHHRRHLDARPNAEHYLIIGPWDHAGTRSPARRFCGIEVGQESMLDLGELHVEWYKWTMAGGPKPSFLQDRVTYYMMSADRWIYAPSIDAISSGTQRLYLSRGAKQSGRDTDGVLAAAPNESGAPATYVFDPNDTSLVDLESLIDPESRSDMRLFEAEGGRRLIYESAPLSDAIEIAGFFKLTAWISIDQPDTDFRAVIYEVNASGSAIELSSSVKRARYRLDENRPKLIETTDPLEYVFDDFMFVAKQIMRGSRIRLTIGPVASIYWQKNHNSGGLVAFEQAGDARVVTVHLYHDRRYPTALDIPLAQSAEGSLTAIEQGEQQ